MTMEGIPAPETYQFHCIPNHENGSWYGYDGWSKNFYKLMTEHPVYIDPGGRVHLPLDVQYDLV